MYEYNENPKVYCAQCGEWIEDAWDQIHTDDGFVCRGCFELGYAIGKQPAQCEDCGEWHRAKDLVDGTICEDCAYEEEEHVPVPSV